MRRKHSPSPDKSEVTCSNMDAGSGASEPYVRARRKDSLGQYNKKRMQSYLKAHENSLGGKHNPPTPPPTAGATCCAEGADLGELAPGGTGGRWTERTSADWLQRDGGAGAALPEPNPIHQTRWGWPVGNVRPHLPRPSSISRNNPYLCIASDDVKSNSRGSHDLSEC